MLKLDIKTELNALIVPSIKNDFSGNPNNSIHGVIGGESEAYYNHIREDKVWLNKSLRISYLNQNKPSHQSGRWLYGGALFFHFGHFLSESIHRLWPLLTNENAEAYEGVIFIVPVWFKGSFENIPGYCREILTKIGCKNILFCRSLIKVDSLDIAEPGSLLGGGVKPTYVELINSYPIYKQTDDTEIKKIFVSRKNFSNDGRTFGMDYISLFLESNGYKEVFPEKLSIQEQVNLLHSADKIIFEEGSAIHALELTNQLKAEVFLLQRRENAKNLHMILNAKSRFLGFYDNVVQIENIVNEHPSKRNSFINAPNILIESLDELGFIKDSKEFDLNNFISIQNENINKYLKEKTKNASTNKR